MHVSHIPLIALLMLTLSANVKASALPAVTGVIPPLGRAGHRSRSPALVSQGDGSAIWLCVGYVVLGQVGDADHRCHSGRLKPPEGRPAALPALLRAKP